MSGGQNTPTWQAASPSIASLATLNPTPTVVSFAQQKPVAGYTGEEVADLAHARAKVDHGAAYGVLYALAALFLVYILSDSPKIYARWRSRRSPQQVRANGIEISNTGTRKNKMKANTNVGGELGKGYFFANQRSLSATVVPPPLLDSENYTYPIHPTTRTISKASGSNFGAVTEKEKTQSDKETNNTFVHNSTTLPLYTLKPVVFKNPFGPTNEDACSTGRTLTTLSDLPESRSGSGSGSESGLSGLRSSMDDWGSSSGGQISPTTGTSMTRTTTSTSTSTSTTTTDKTEEDTDTEKPAARRPLSVSWQPTHRVSLVSPLDKKGDSTGFPLPWGSRQKSTSRTAPQSFNSMTTHNTADRTWRRYSAAMSFHSDRAPREFNRRPSIDIISPPIYAPGIFSWIPYSTRILLWTPFPKLFPHLVLSGIFLQSSYVILIAVTLFYKIQLSPNPETNPVGPDWYRSGLLAMVQIPICVGLGGRNSVIRYVLAGGHDQAVTRLHKLSGRLLFFCSLLHSCLYFNKWAQKGSTFFAHASSATPIIWGYVALGAVSLIVVTSLPFVRRTAHGVFTICHYIGIVLLLLGLGLHIRVAQPYVWAAAACYLFDIVLRAIKTKYTSASIVALRGSDSTIVHLNRIADGWRAGQHVILRIPALTGSKSHQLMSGLEAHSFTIASAPDSDEGLTLIVKSAGNWSKDLHSLAASKVGEEKNTESALRKVFHTKLIVEGPYGGPGHTMFASFSSVLLVGGGSGITYPLCIAKDLLHKVKNEPNSVRAKVIDLVWSVRTQEIARPFMATLLAMINDAKSTEQGGNSISLRVHVFITQCTEDEPIELVTPQLSARSSFADDAISHSISELTVSSGRPNLNEIVEETVDYMIDQNENRRVKNRGCGVAVCGPSQIVCSTREAVRGLKESKRVKMGGVELHEEFFGY